MSIEEAIELLEENGATVTRAEGYYPPMYNVDIYDFIHGVQQELTLIEDEVIALCEEYFMEG